MSGSLITARMAGRVPIIAISLLLAIAGAAAAQDASPTPTAVADGPSLATPAPGESGASMFPLPEIVAGIPADIPTVSLEPESPPAAIDLGVPMPFTLGHCGLLSPIDLDGSLWQPVGGTSADGGPIAGEDEMGELISATDGEFVLTGGDEAVFTTALGSRIALVRAAGAVDYGLCM